MVNELLPCLAGALLSPSEIKLPLPKSRLQQDIALDGEVYVGSGVLR